MTEEPLSEAADVTGSDDNAKVSERVLAEARDALAHVELINVVPVEISATSRGNPRPAATVRVDVTSQFQVGVGVFGNRFRYDIELLDQDEEPTADLDFTLQVEYDVEEDYEPTSEAAEFLAGTTGLFGAYPYARELAQNLAARLQQDPIVLGLMPRGATVPRAVTRIERSAGHASDRSRPSEDRDSTGRWS